MMLLKKENVYFYKNELILFIKEFEGNLYFVNLNNDLVVIDSEKVNLLKNVSTYNKIIFKIKYFIVYSHSYQKKYKFYTPRANFINNY